MRRSPSHSLSHSRLGFTLIELLVVIAIIVTLAGISFTAFRSFRASANESSSASNMRQIGIAIQTYVADKGRYPSPGVMDSDEYLVAWDRILLNNLGDPNFDFKQGRDKPILKNTPAAAALGQAEKILYCPGDSAKAPAGQMRRSYAMCPWTVSQGGPGFTNGFSGIPAGTGPPASRVSEPDRAVVLVEFQSREGRTQNVIGGAAYDYLFGFRNIPQDTKPANYHKNNQLVLFVDGHVESIPGNINRQTWEQKGYSPHVPRR
jgi:prepilin-type N-terminal cleavage/methylation domain-containing protein